MRTAFLIAFLFLPATLAAQTIPAGRWDVTSTAVDIVAPGVPSFLVRMMKGKSKSERKCVSPDSAKTGIVALLAPDPKAQCHVDSQQVADGHYAQALTCPQKQGAPIGITRFGHYDANGFSGRLDMAGQTPKGPMSMVLDQQASHVPGTC
jgi:hypothetical protein